MRHPTVLIAALLSLACAAPASAQGLVPATCPTPKVAAKLPAPLARSFAPASRW